jgi:hypothetical protein
MTRRALRGIRAAGCAAALLIAPAASAQSLWSEPFTFGGGRIVLGGDAAVAVAPKDTGFFNYSDYELTTLRQVRFGMSAAVRVSDRVSVLGELRSENFNHIAPFALYARIRPLPGRRFDVQIGRIPPTFGSLSRRSYGNDNPLIGSPIAYQYMTSLRPDSTPADLNELIRMRGRGWLSGFSVGDRVGRRGVPLVSSFTWDTGVQVSTGWNMVSVAAAVTNGSPSSPRFSDDNGGKQVSVRTTVTPTTGLTLGTSYARGEFLDRQVRRLLTAPASNYDQRAFEFDIEYSRDHWLTRAETVWSEWTIPIGTSGNATPLSALATTLEGRYSFLPGWYAAARIEHLGFSDITIPPETTEWEAPVTRTEAGIGYYVQRNFIVKTTLQFNRRDGGRINSSQLLAVQLLYWF